MSVILCTYESTGVSVWLSFKTHWIKEQNTSIIFFMCSSIIPKYQMCPVVCVCVHTCCSMYVELLEELRCVSSIWVPFHVCLLIVWLFFFSGYRSNLPWMPQCTRQSNSSKLVWFSCAIFAFVPLLVILNCTAYFKCLICLYFRWKYLTSFKFQRK